MRVIWSSQAWEDDILWQETDPRTVRKINVLIKDAGRDPFRGLGKPEPSTEASSKRDYSAAWRP